MQKKLIHPAFPIYPQNARKKNVTGTVHLRVIISRDGTIKQIEVVYGPQMLIQSALDCVRQWRYEPTLLNGRAVEVETFIDVTYELG